jgi:hypothetical protein
MVRRCGREVHGVLNDFDLALDLCTEHDAEKSRKHITGTRLFMSCELLDPEPQEVHSGRHDLESLFWVVIWFIHRYQDGKECEPDHEGRRPLDDWLTTSDLASKKWRILATGWEPQPVWKEARKEWIRRLSDIYFYNGKDRSDLLEDLKPVDSMTPAQPEELMRRLDELKFRNDLTTWETFVETITRKKPADYDRGDKVLCDLDDISAIKFKPLLNV